MSVRNIEVESLSQLRALVSEAGTEVDTSGWHFQSLDLRSVDMTDWTVRGAVFLGCIFDPGVENSLRNRGALIFPVIPQVPFNAYRQGLYTAAELYSNVDHQYERSLDGRIYHWTLASERSLDYTLATAMHDHAIGDALEDFLQTNTLPMVGVMGGHAGGRDSAVYHDAARLGQRLGAAGFLVATGGGPGAMEAANFGARMSKCTAGELDAAVRALAKVPDFRPSISAWAQAGFEVLENLDAQVPTLGIPTWFYGHEPPNVFATAIAKYFANSVREAVLLERCTGGIVFLPGAGGTLQEIFQDGCENYYAADSAARPMVLLGVEYWTKHLPVWELLKSLAKGRSMEQGLLLTDEAAEAVRFLKEFPAAPASSQPNA